ncbi:MAG: hypothetical protein LH606_13870 [Cytophagaceae bacterium]|nr:hypothetical protein [Cytophagaceae bacterium]
MNCSLLCQFILVLLFSPGMMAQSAHEFPAYSGQALVPVVKVSSGRTIHRFFDTSPLSPSGRYLALFRFPQETRSPQPGEVGEVILVDRQTGQERVVAQSRGWEMQLGANVQWGRTDEELYFNDVDTTTWQAFALQLNPLTGQARRMGGTVFMASPDGTKLATYNLISSRRAQAGYGVVVPKDRVVRNVGPVEADGIDVVNTATGQAQRVVTIRRIYEKTVPSIAIANPQEFEYYCFQVKWNPQGTRLLTTMQWAPLTGGPRRRAVITMRPDGSDLRTAITPDQWAKGGHHINWTPDGEHLSMNLNVDGKPGLEIITVRYDGSDLKTVFSPGSGHPSFQTGGLPFMVTDAYPGELGLTEGSVPIRLMNVQTGTEQTLVSIFLSKAEGEFRIDAHPAWDRSGRYVIFNGFTDGTRGVFLADVTKLLGLPAPKAVSGGR